MLRPFGFTYTLEGRVDELSMAGYVITAVGSNPAGGWILVGTKARASAAQRGGLVTTGGEPEALSARLAAGYAVVGMIEGDDTRRLRVILQR